LSRWVSLLLLIIVGAGGYAAYQWLKPSAEDQIRSLLTDLAETASIQPGTKGVAKLRALARLPDFFTADITLDLSVQAPTVGMVQGRVELKDLMAVAQSQLRSLQIDFVDIHIQMGAERVGALAQTIVEATMDPGEDPGVQEYKIWLKLTEDGWRIDRVESVRSLSV